MYGQLELEEFDEINDTHQGILTCQSYLREERPEELWDCESIISTYSTLDNHPSVIKVRQFSNRMHACSMHVCIINCAAASHRLILTTQIVFSSFLFDVFDARNPLKNGILYHFVISVAFILFFNICIYFFFHRIHLHQDLDHTNHDLCEHQRLKRLYMPRDPPYSQGPQIRVLYQLTVFPIINHY